MLVRANFSVCFAAPRVAVQEYSATSTRRSFTVGLHILQLGSLMYAVGTEKKNKVFSRGNENVIGFGASNEIFSIDEYSS